MHFSVRCVRIGTPLSARTSAMPFCRRITWPLLDSGESTGAFCSRPATPDTKRVHGLLRMVRQEQVIAGTWWLKAAAGRQCQQRKDHRCYGKNDRCYCKYNPCDPLQRQRRVFLGFGCLHLCLSHSSNAKPDQQQTDARVALLHNVIEEFRRDKEELRRAAGRPAARPRSLARRLRSSATPTSGAAAT